MLPIIKKISNFNHSGRNGQTIKYIVMHYTGTSGTDTALNNANYFCNGNRDASANYFIDDNNIVQVVDDSEASWNCGDGNGKYGITNQNSIGIEMCGTNGDISQNTEANALELVKVLMTKYGISIDRVVRHYDASRKMCPAPWSKDNWSKWNEFKGKLGDGNNIIQETERGILDPDVNYQVHTQKHGWLPYVRNLEDYAGVYGTPIDGIKINPTAGTVKYRAHLLGGNWLPWVANLEDYAGIYGNSIDGIQMVTADMPHNSIEYRAYIGGNWLPWVRSDYDYAGIYGTPITGLQIKII